MKVFYKVSSLSKKMKLVLIWLQFEILSQKTSLRSTKIVIYTISGIKAILQDSSVKIADDEGVSPSSSVITRVSCNML
jgi:hypothetical protein